MPGRCDRCRSTKQVRSVDHRGSNSVRIAIRGIARIPGAGFGALTRLGQRMSPHGPPRGEIESSDPLRAAVVLAVNTPAGDAEHRRPECGSGPSRSRYGRSMAGGGHSRQGSGGSPADNIEFGGDLGKGQLLVSLLIDLGRTPGGRVRPAVTGDWVSAADSAASPGSRESAPGHLDSGMYGSVNVHCCVGYGRRLIGSRFCRCRALAASASGGRALVVTLTLGKSGTGAYIRSVAGGGALCRSVCS